jgi:hypothetical protein
MSGYVDHVGYEVMRLVEDGNMLHCRQVRGTQEHAGPAPCATRWPAAMAVPRAPALSLSAQWVVLQREGNRMVEQFFVGQRAELPTRHG